jgi:hypothetical protein
MVNEEFKQYLKDNLKLVWHFDKGELFIKLRLENELISKIPFARD